MKLIPSSLLSLTLTATAMAASGGADGHGESASIFAGTIIQSLSAVIVFVVLLFVLTKFAWGPILKGLQDREAKIKNDLHKAEVAAAQAAITLKEYQDKLAKAQADAENILASARKDAEQTAFKVQAETRAEIDSMKKRATADIRFAKEQALNEIYAEAATLSTTVASRILGRAINADDQKVLVEQAITEMGKFAKNN